MIRLVKYWNVQNSYPFISFDLEQHIARTGYYNCSNLKDYFFSYMLYFGASDDSPQRTKDSVDRAKKIINKVKEYEKNNMPVRAEVEIRKLLPIV